MSNDSNLVDRLLMQDDTIMPYSSSVLSSEESQFIVKLTELSKKEKQKNPNFDTRKYIQRALMHQYGQSRADEILRIIWLKQKRKQEAMQTGRMPRENFPTNPQPPLQHHPMHLQSITTHPQQDLQYSLPQSHQVSYPAPLPHVGHINNLAVPTSVPLTSTVGTDHDINGVTQHKPKAPPKKKKETSAGGKRKALQDSEQRQPPAKKVKKAVDSTKSKKKSTATKSSAKKSGEDNVPKESLNETTDEYAMEKAHINDVIPKEVEGLARYGIEKVLSKESYDLEAVKANDSMRKDFAEMRSVLSRGKSDDEDANFGVMCDDTNVAVERVSVIDKQLLNNDKAQALCKNVLLPRRMNYTRDALSALTDGMQYHFRTLIESAISSYHKRTNHKAIEHYRQMDNILTSTMHTMSSSGNDVLLGPGDVKPENKAFYGLMFGSDIAHIMTEEYTSNRDKIQKSYENVEEKMRECLAEADESFKKSSKKSGKQDTEKNKMPWWKREESLEKEGLLTWQELALTRLKHKVAAQYNLGPNSRKKKLREGEDTKLESESSQGMPMDIIESESKVNETVPHLALVSQEKIASPFADADGTSEEGGSGKVIFCLTKDDAMTALGKHTGQRYLHGEGYSASYGNVLKIAQSTL